MVLVPKKIKKYVELKTRKENKKECVPNKIILIKPFKSSFRAIKKLGGNSFSFVSPKDMKMKNYINAYKDLIVVLHKAVKFNEKCIHLMRKEYWYCKTV